MIRALLVTALMAGCGGSATTTASEAPEDRTITGRFTLNSATVDRNADLTRCEGTGGYEDIEQGASVTLRDGDGNVAGTSRLEVAGADAFGNFPGCIYTFTFDDVADADFYAVEIGDRGEIVYSRADLEAADWRIVTELGE